MLLLLELGVSIFDIEPGSLLEEERSVSLIEMLFGQVWERRSDISIGTVCIHQLRKGAFVCVWHERYAKGLHRLPRPCHPETRSVLREA